MKRLSLALATLAVALVSRSLASGAALPAIEVNSGGHYLQTADGRPFFWLGDTAWQLIDGATREECAYYLHARGEQGFTIIQTTVLAELDGLNHPSALGERPFADNDPARPNESYFDHVVEVVDAAAANHLYVALLPTWGDKLTAPWGDGPRIFRNDNLPVVHAYARYLAAKLKDRTNVVWMLGGDRPPVVPPMSAEEFAHYPAAKAGFAQNQDWRPIWRELAAGLEEGLGRKPVCLYHPSGGFPGTSAYLENESWLAINGMQSGHGGGHDVPVWTWIARDFALTPAKPTLDLEPNYEDHPYNPWPTWDPSTGYFRDYDVRKQTYRSVFAGACGVTYGHHAVWQFATKRRTTINHVDRDWIDALYRPAARQMRFLRELIESRPFFDRIRDQALIASGEGEGGLHIEATRDRAGTYALVYCPLNDQKITIDFTRLKAQQLRAWWYDPRTGVGTLIGEFSGEKSHTFEAPPFGPDWVLVLDEVAARYAPPGSAPISVP